MRQRNPDFRSGLWLAQCDRCGFDFWSNQLRKEWTGLRVCKKCWEPRHPQDYVRGVPDRQAPAWTRPPDTPNEPFANDGGTDITPDDL